MKLSNDQWTLSVRNPRWSAINRAIRTSSQGWGLARSSGASPQPSRDCSDSDPWTAKDALAVPRQKRVMRIDEPMEPKRPIEPQNQPRGRVEGFRDDHSAPVVEFDRRVFWCRGRPGCTTPQPSPGVLVLLTAAPSRTRIRRCWRTAPCRAVAQLLSYATTTGRLERRAFDLFNPFSFSEVLCTSRVGPRPGVHRTLDRRSVRSRVHRARPCSGRPLHHGASAWTRSHLPPAGALRADEVKLLAKG